jgi:hypothetical protein
MAGSCLPSLLMLCIELLGLQFRIPANLSELFSDVKAEIAFADIAGGPRFVVKAIGLQEPAWPAIV